MMLWVIAYDIADDRRRTNVFDRLAESGFHVQYSVFECRLSPGELKCLRTELLALVDTSEDALAWFPVCHWDSMCIYRSGKTLKYYPTEDTFVI